MVGRAVPVPRGYRRAVELRIGDRVECHGHVGRVVSLRGDYGTHRHPLARITLQLSVDSGGILSWYLEASEIVRLMS